MDSQDNDGLGSTFWKKSFKPVPGRPSPLKEAIGKVQQNSSCTSFQDFQESTSDAWDIGDDEFSNNLDANAAYSTAIEVLNAHRMQNLWKQEINKIDRGIREPDTVFKPVSGEVKTNASKQKSISCENDPVSSKLNSVSELSETALSKVKSVSEISETALSKVKSVSGVSETTVSVVNSVSEVSETALSKVKSVSGVSETAVNKVKSVSGVSCETAVTTVTTVSKVKSVSGASETALSKLAKFQALLQTTVLNLDELRKLSWSGIPDEVRPMAWRLLTGYLPASSERRKAVTEGKRRDYWNSVKQYFDKERDTAHRETYRQIHIDVPRMSPSIPLFQQKIVQEAFERILFVWAIRHPASGYVQGVNDLVTPFYVVFLQERLPPGCESDSFDVGSLPKQQRDVVEADSFWCFSNFLDRVQDNYIFAQVGIQRKVGRLRELVKRVDGALHEHLEDNGADYLQFTFRWMNNLLTRELPLRRSIRLWDTYLAEADDLAAFQIYVCAAFLLRWRRELLLEKDFQGLMTTLQNLPTREWTDCDVGVLVAEAFKLKFAFADAPNHLQNKDGR